MARTPDDALRASLVRRAFDYVCAHGLSDLSLRPLAEALGSSPSLLLYHFGSKDQLVMKILEAGRDEQDAVIAELASETDLSPAAIGRTIWRMHSSKRFEPLTRLFFEVYALALQDRSRFPGFLERSVEGWLDVLEGSRRGDPQARIIATIVLAAFRGFRLDLAATRDRKRVDRAVEQFFSLIEAVPQSL